MTDQRPSRPATPVAASGAAPARSDVKPNPLPADTSAVALARALLARHAPGLAGEPLHDALLMVSELVSNAVRHGRPDISLHVDQDDRGLDVGVDDHGPALPAGAGAAPEPGATSGRGLVIVDALATAWGVEPHPLPPGKTVWFHLDHLT